MISIQGIYDGKKLRLFEKIKVRSPKKIIVTFLDNPDDEITTIEIHYLVDNGGSFDFLSENEKDIYTDKDLKLEYK